MCKKNLRTPSIVQLHNYDPVQLELDITLYKYIKKHKKKKIGLY